VSQSRKGRPAKPVPVDKLYAYRAKGVTWVEQAKLLGVSHNTIARWWRKLGAAEERGEDPRGVNDPTPGGVNPAGPARANFQDPNFDPADISPAERTKRFLRRVAIAESEGGADALRAVIADMGQLAKLQAEQSYAGVLADAAHAALAATCQRLAAYLQGRCDPVSAARRVVEEKAPENETDRAAWLEREPERKAAKAWIAAHPEDDELERLYRASAAATASDEDRDALASWIDARPEIMREITT
jgi:hypothetical protein